MITALVVSGALLAAAGVILAALRSYTARRERDQMRRHVGGAPWEWWGR